MAQMEVTDEQKRRFGDRLRARMEDRGLKPEDMIGAGRLKMSDKRLRQSLQGFGPVPRDGIFGVFEHLLDLEEGSAKESLLTDTELKPRAKTHRSATYTADEVAELRELERVMRAMGIDNAEFFKAEDGGGYVMTSAVAAELITRANELLELVRANKLDRQSLPGPPE